MKTEIYYDGDCPFCTQYIKLLKLKEATGNVSITSLRDNDNKRKEFERKGYELDSGMVVVQGGNIFHGEDAIHQLALMTTPSGAFNRLTATLFSNPLATKLAYPFMRSCRIATLTLMGRQGFREWNAGEKALFEISARLFGLFSILHVFIYFFRYDPGTLRLSMLGMLCFGFILILRPTSVRVFILLTATMVVDAWLQAPLSSNHTILKNFWLLTLTLSGIWFWLKGKGFEEFFRNARPIGQSLLLIMYIYGIFHKINSDFLDPEVSCAVELWKEMPTFLSWIDYSWFYQIGIYGTFAVEGLIMVALMLPKTRHLGIVFGIGFHSLLAMSGYAMYAVFSTLSIFLHTLFLSPAGALAVVESRAWKWVNGVLRRPVFVTLLLLMLVTIAWSALLKDFTGVSLVWLMTISPLLFCIICYGGRGEPCQPVLWSPTSWLNIITIAFFINGAMPYMGLKTAQTINMFANLRLEAGISNHLVFRDSPRLFTYLNDTAKVHKADPGLKMDFFFTRDDNLIVYYDLLNRMDHDRNATVSFTRNGILYENVSYADLREDAERLLHSQAVRKYFHFRWVRDSEKITCDMSAPWQNSTIL